MDDGHLDGIAWDAGIDGREASFEKGYLAESCDGLLPGRTGIFDTPT